MAKRGKMSFLVPMWEIPPVVAGRWMGPVKCEQVKNASFVEILCWA
jgi:hypothetical protein